MSKHVWAGGARFLVTDEFDETNPEDMAALTELGKYFATRLAESISPEMAERQVASRERIQDRNARLHAEPTRDERL